MPLLNRFLILLLTTQIYSCVAYTSFPELPDVKPTPQPAIAPNPTLECIKLAMPDPIPSTVHIAIVDGKVEADKGGEALIRNYAGFRKLVKESWYSH